MEIVLVEPEIPGNTGNIARLCAANHMSLHLVKPLGFSLDSKYLKRAGLDYWHLLDLHIHESFEEVLAAYADRRFFYATTKAKHTYAEVSCQYGDMLVFGKETKGLPEELLAANYESTIRIPMIDAARSLNLSNSVAIIAYEGMRQLGFPDMKQLGALTSVNVVK